MLPMALAWLRIDPRVAPRDDDMTKEAVVL
jgi:hypothetical protein